MQEPEAQLAKARFARRHLSKMAGIGLAALIARVAMPKPAKASVCFLKGTSIRTVDGERKIEDLGTEELVLTQQGPRLITAISHFVIAKPWPREAIPVRIAQSALADGVPHTDLFVSQGHSIIVDGEWMMAQGLINDSSITYADDLDDLTELEYFHIKLESHEAIYAAGALCESCAADLAEEFWVPSAFHGRRSQIASHWRSALSPWIDRRTPVDVARDRLECRALHLS